MLLFYKQDLVSQGSDLLPEEEARHCLKVLRMKTGDFLYLTDGKGALARVQIETDNPKKCTVRTVEFKRSEKPYQHYIHIAIAPTKNADRMEWFVEKCVEIGVDEISFIRTEHSERQYFNTDRIEKKAISALKQSLKTWLPAINAPVDFSAFIGRLSAESQNMQKFIAYVDRENETTLFKAAEPARPYCVLIGPEGDFTLQEVAQAINSGFVKVSLGKSRLRTETAGIAACHTLNLLNE